MGQLVPCPNAGEQAGPGLSGNVPHRGVRDEKPRPKWALSLCGSLVGVLGRHGVHLRPAESHRHLLPT
jgi:hypothetical protein